MQKVQGVAVTLMLLAWIATGSVDLRRASTLDDPQPNGPTYAETKCFDDMVVKAMKDNSIPGSSFAVLAHGKVVYAQGYGSVDVPDVGDDRGRKVMPYTPFRIASISKPVTALAIVRLEQLGKLGLDDLVFGKGGHLENMYQNANPNRPVVDSRLESITIRHLLTQTAGWSSAPMIQCLGGHIGHCSSGMGGTIKSALDVEGPASCTDAIYYMLGEALAHQPGTQYRYSNFGYCVLGRVLESVTGKSYEQAVREAFLDLAGINPWEMYLGHTLLDDTRENETEYSCPHCPLADSVFPQVAGKVLNPYGAWNLEAMDAHGGWVASAQQLMLMVKAMDDLLTQDSLQKIVAKPPAYAGTQTWYGLGFAARAAGHGHNIWHDGLLPGSSSVMVRYFSGYAIAHLHNVHGAVDKFDTWGLIRCVQGTWPTNFSIESPLQPERTTAVVTTTVAQQPPTKTTSTLKPVTSNIGYSVRRTCEPGTEISSSAECQAAYAALTECSSGACRWGQKGNDGDQAWSSQRPSHCAYHPWGIIQHFTGSAMPTVNQDCMQHGYGGCICKVNTASATTTTTTVSPATSLTGYEIRPSCEAGMEITSSAECRSVYAAIAECASGCTWGQHGHDGNQVWSAERPSHCAYHPWGIVQHFVAPTMPAVNQDCTQHGYGGCICKTKRRRLIHNGGVVLV